jgi:pimeloyl-ACP methyl ester carboxylesterase
MTELIERPRNNPASPRGRVHSIHYELSYLHQGIVDPAAPVVVLLHGFPGDATVWKAVMPAITTHPVLAFDLLGNGESDKPWPADTSVWGHADALNLAMRDMGLQQVILVGYDLGGGVAQVLATRLMPERTRGLALVASNAFQHTNSPDWPLTEMEKRKDPEVPRHTSVDDLAAALRATVPGGSAHPESLTGAALEALVTPWLSELGKEIFFQQIQKMAPFYLNAVAADLAHLTCPTTIIWGERDTIFPPIWGERLKRAIPNATLTTIPSAGHLVLHDAPDHVGQALARFVTGIN